MNQDVLEKYLQKEGFVRASVIRATQLIEEMRKVHGTYDIGTIVMGRAMMGALLMAAHLKKGENVGVYLRGNGPMGTVFAEGDHAGNARSYSANPKIQLPLKNQKLDISGAIGVGILEVIRGSQWTDFLQKGAVELQTGQVGDDIAYYLYQSHQIPSVVGLTVELNADGTVKVAGGILIELMPGADDRIISKIEENMGSVRALSELLIEQEQLKLTLDEYLSDFDMVKIDENKSIKYHCRCSKERVERAFFLIGIDELDNMIKDGQGSEKISCDFCGRQYTLTLDEIKEIRQKAFRSTLN